ncbi:hypothetical protein PG985_005163 [Apiospora marii]
MAQVQSTAYDAALRDFLDTLRNDRHKRKQLAFFEDIIEQNNNASVEDLRQSVDALMRPRTGNHQVRGYFRGVVQVFEDYSGVMEVFVQVQPMPMALIWGGLKILVQCAGRCADNLEKIKTHVDDLQRFLAWLSDCEDVHGVSVYGAEAVQRILRAAYTSILEFYYYATKTLENPLSSALRENRSLSSVVNDLERHWKHLCRIRDGAEAQLNKELREKVLEESISNEEMRNIARTEFANNALERCLNEAERKAQQHFRDTEEERRKEEERTRFSTEVNILYQFKEELRSNGIGDGSVNDLCQDILSDRTTGTCKWILEHPTFQKWKGVDCERPILWLNGKHGSGKTYLCASVADAISSEESKKGIAFLRITSGQDWPKSYLIRTLTYQLLNRIRTLDMKDLASLERLISNGPDSCNIEELIRHCLQLLPITFILIDGLDEVELAATPPDHNPNNSGLPSFVKFLIKQATGLPQKVRLWCSSQATQSVRGKMLDPNWNKIAQISLTTADTAGDILSYIKSEMQGTKDFNDLVFKTFITSSVETDAEGSFLWCRMMLNALKEEESETETESIKDQIALMNRGLPKTMEAVYGRIVKRIQERYLSRKDIPLWK